MKTSRNLYRDTWAERLIENTAGPLHAVPPEGVRPDLRTGPKPYEDPDEARICLDCPLEQCALDEAGGRCRRYAIELRKLRRQQQHDDEKRD